MRPNQISQQEHEPNPGVDVGDHIYVQHRGQHCVGVVCAHGKHGATVEIDGKHHKIKWKGVLGHKKRAQANYNVVDEGEDGMLVEDAHGKRKFIAMPNEAKEDPMVAKSFGRRPVALFMKGIAPRPGLSEKKLTDKRGVPTTRWVKVDRGGPQAQPGQHVGFQNGEHRGHGEVAAAGKHGVTVRDQAGGEHRILHEHVTHHWRGEGAPDKSPHDADPPARPNWDMRMEGENDKQYAKRVIDKGANVDKLPEDHGRYFNEGGETVPLSNLHSTKTEEENKQGGDNGPKRMLAAYHGALGKRDPITVMPHESKEGHYEVVDGNGTMTSAQNMGWSSLPVRKVSRDEGLRMKSEDAAKDAAKQAADPAKYDGAPKTAKQPSADPDELYRKAEEGLQHLKKWLNLGKGIASRMGYQTMNKGPDKVTDEEWDKPGGMLFIAGLKARDGRAAEKVAKDYKDDWSQLADIVRCTLAADNLNDLSDAIKTLEAQGMKVAKQPKNKFLKPTPQGYRDMNFVVRLPNGILAEVQFNVKDMIKAKNEAHHFYEETRKINGKYTERGIGDPDNPDFEKWSAEDLDAFSVAENKQIEIYDKAWLEHIKKHYGKSKDMLKSLVLFWRPRK